MPKWFIPAAVVCGLMFAIAPVLIAAAPYESTMGLVQKIFYVHLPSAWMFLIGAIVCGVASVRFLFGGDPSAGARYGYCPLLGRVADVLRRGVRHARALDVRAIDD